MRLTLWITAALCVLLGFYIATPLIALHKMESAVENRDAVALEERVDWPALRRSLTKQVFATYLKLTGKNLPIGAIGKRLAVSVADPIVARLMTIRALLDLLGKGEAGEGAKVPTDRVPFTATSFDSVWRLWVNSDYLGRDFHISLPPEGPRAQQFNVQLRLIRWRWRLVGIELPEELKEQLARELVKQTQERLKPPRGRQ
jgi:hypothetical protein